MFACSQLNWLMRVVSWHCVPLYSCRFGYSLISTMVPGDGRSSESLSRYQSVSVKSSESMSCRLASYDTLKTYQNNK
ncbi:hypothetical protein PF011_g16524 [Phytophthora fragariae]|uniref:Secreted protein n=1 Tax=Phytophthora fragariae TaxID=53985 RepID=A0A6A3JNA8_9STRA|nr:hypothetical protein PF011_g16524 [Phytophthora fragariae]